MTIVIDGGGTPGGIEELTSSTLTITNPTGPTVDVEVPTDAYVPYPYSIPATDPTGNPFGVGPSPLGNSTTGGDYAQIQAILTVGATLGMATITAPVTYWLEEPLVLSSSATFGPMTSFKAAANFPTGQPLLTTPNPSGVPTLLTGLKWQGGIWDANFVALNCFYPRYSVTCVASGMTFNNAPGDWLVVGDNAAAAVSIQFYGYDLQFGHPLGNLPSDGAALIHVQNGSDCEFWGCQGVGAYIGAYIQHSDCKFYGCHFNPATAFVTFLDASTVGGSEFHGCTADTPVALSRTCTSSGNVITDSFMLSRYTSLPISGTNIPAGAYVGNVSGSAFNAVDKFGNTLTLGGSVTSYLLGGVGYQLNAPSAAKLVGSRALMGPAAGTTQTCYGCVIGPLVTTASASSFSVNSSTSNQWIAAFGGLTDVLSWTGLQQSQVENVLPTEQLFDVPPRDWLPTAAIAQTFPRWVGGVGSQSALSGGRLSLYAIYLVAGTTIGHIAFISGGTGITFSGTGGAWWFELLDKNANVLAQTANQDTTAWGTFTTMSLAIAATNTIPSNPSAGASQAATTLTVPYTGLYYLGINVYPGSTGTVCSLESATPAAVVAGLTPILYGTSDTGQTGAPPTMPHQSTALTTGTAQSIVPYAYVAA